MQAASVQKHQKAVLGFLHGKYLSFRKGHSSHIVTFFDHTISGLRNRGETTGIPCVVVVRVAVRVDIAEIVGVVVIWRTHPPIGSSNNEQKSRYDKINRDTPNFSLSFLVAL